MNTAPTAPADLKPLIAAVAAGRRLSEAEAEQAFDIMMSGNATPSQLGGFLMGLRVRGETVDEIAGAVRAMRARMTRIDAPPGAIDTCGTGGDGSGSWNISTATALVVAGCGVPVAKHGNRAMSSKTGAADVLGALGVNLDADMALVRKALWEAHICFMLAPRHHSAMRHVGPTRVELGTRTIFNLMGPMSNPAGAARQLVGVFSRDWIAPMAEVLGRLGTERAWVVHGSDGMDEITTTGATHVAALENGKVTTFEVTPESVGLKRATAAELKGGDSETNAQALRDVLAGKTGAYRDIVLLNAAAALVVAGKAADLAAGVKLADAAIASGKARAALSRLVAITNEKPAA
jgi:anthranilate phosphoribosyltransferase